MKNAKRWLAILLAVTLLCSNGVSQLGMIVSASELETTEEAQPKEDAVVEQAEETKEDTGKATVEGVTPEEERGESSAQDAETANVPKAAAQEGQNEANVPEAAPATVAPTTATPATVTPATAVPAAEGAGQAEEAAAPEVQTYNVKINKSELDGGQIKVWGSDNTQVDVTEYDGNNQYVKEVKEGEEFNFQITLKDGFDGAQVKVNGNAFDPANTEGNVITYKVAGINEEKVIDVTYNKVETPTEEKAAEEPKSEDETKVEKPAVEDSTATAEMEDNSINTASLNENISTVAEHKDTETEKWIKINDKVTLSNSYSNRYIHNWNVEDNEVATVSGSGNTVKVTGKKVGKTKVTDTVSRWWETIEIIEYTIHVTPNVVATNITISGSDTVTQFKTTQLTASFTPEDADGTVSWSSSNDEILTVNDSGLVTGNRLGTATVTASVQGKDNKTLSATKEVTVVKNENTADSNIVEASVYYLGDPNNDPNSNDTGQWGDEYGVATVNIEGATWKNNKNCFDNVDQRVVSWPNGSNVISTGTPAWNTIYENYKTTIESQFKGLKFEKDDVEEISLVPVKISKDNRVDEYSSKAVHLDCRVNIKCKNIALVKYFLFDVGGAGYVQKGSQNYIINDSAITDPTSVTGEDFPQTKTVSGVTYTFSGWYTDQSLTTPAPVFPAKVTGSVDYYAKYVAGYYVTYDLQGGTFSDGSSLSEKYNVDTTVTVKSNPTRAGYRFTGWKVEGLGTTTSLNSGDTFIMPDNSVKLTAQWEEQKIEDFITLTPANVTKVYNGRVYAAGEAKVVGKDEGADTASVKIEYSLNGTDWTTNPSEITATNVSDSKTVQVRATSEKYTDELTGTENLTITKRPITITGDGWTSDQPYKGNEYKKTTYTVEEANAENTSGLVAGQTAEVTYELKGTNVGNYTGTFGTAVIKNGEEDVTANYTVTKTPGTLIITKAEIAQYVTLTPVNVTKVYDGNTYAAGRATATDENGNDLKIEYQKADGSWTEDPSEITATNVSDSATVNVRVSSEGNYNGYVNGTEELKITARPITITGDGWTSDQPYTGSEYQTTTYTVEEANAENTSGLVAGQTAEVTYELKGTNVGNYTGTFGTAVIKNGEEDVTANYTVTKTPGTLIITKAEIAQYVTLTPVNVTKVYDGNTYAAGRATATDENGNDLKIEYQKADGSWTEDPSEITATNVSDSATVNVRVSSEGNYDGYVTGTEELKITARPITITGDGWTSEQPYTGSEYQTTIYTVEEANAENTRGLVAGQTAEVTYELKGTNVGNYTGTFGTAVIKNGEEDVTANYTVTKTPGTLIITKAEIAQYVTLTPVNVTKVYDGNTYAAGRATATDENGNDLKIEYQKADGSWTEDPSEITATNVSDSATVNVRVSSEGNYNGYVNGTEELKITARPITITGDGWTSDQPYTGSEYQTTTYTVEEANAENTSGLVAGQTAEVTYELKGTNVGNYTGTFGTAVIKNGEEDVTANYTVTKTPGTLIITKAEIAQYVTLTPVNVTKVYDGNTYAAGRATATDENGNDLKIEYQKADGSWTEDPSEITATNVSDSATVNVRVSSEGNYAGYVTGTEKLTITPKPVTVTANDLNKTYKETDPELTATVTGTLGEDILTYDLSRVVGEDVGKYPITASGEGLQGNYSVTYYPGTLTITAATRPEDRQLGVTSYEGVYDANEHMLTVDNVLDGDVVEYSYDGGETWTTNLNQYKDVTETTIKVRVTNANYDPSPVELEGTVKITPATLTVSTPTVTRVYEGTPLTAAGTISGFVNGETATFTTTGSQTEVGSTANTYSLTWDGTAKESNYTVAETIGTLTVTAQSIDPENPDYKGITVDAPTDVEYTGADQTWLPTVTDGNGKALVKDTDYTVTYDNEDRTNVTGIITVTINGAGNYAGTITRTYQITPKPIMITTESKTRAFDGTALTAGGKVEGIVSGETYGFKTTGSQTYVGSSQNTYEMVWADSEVEGTSGTYTAKKTNYTVTESIGTLVVTAGTPENPLDPTLVVNKTHDKSQTYKAGDVITFTITAKNIYEEAKTITLEELEGVALDANVFENVAPGAEVTATATYTVTEQDIVNGTFTNNVTVTFSGVDDKFTGTDTVDELEDANPHMTITKTTVGAEEGHIYKLNDVINYKITATNDGNLTLTNVKVEDALTGNVGENAFTIDTLAPGEAQTFDVRYVVTENDVLAGKVINNATGTATDATDPDEPKTPVTPGEKEDPIETPNPSLAVVKTSDKTGVVKLGETITYTITVTNNGNVTINDIEVTDELTGNTGDNAFTIDRLAVGETKQFTATYTVTEDDILEGTIVNRATATGKDPRNEEVTGEGEVRVDTEEKDDSKKDDSKKDDSKKDDSKKNNSDKKPGAVKTGDATDVIPFFGMTVLAAGAAIVIALKKKRRA